MLWRSQQADDDPATVGKFALTRPFGSRENALEFIESAPSRAWDMVFDPEEVATLTNHGKMELRSAVTRAMMLLNQERDLATIVREAEPPVLNFDSIKDIARRRNGEEPATTSE